MLQRQTLGTEIRTPVILKALKSLLNYMLSQEVILFELQYATASYI